MSAIWSRASVERRCSQNNAIAKIGMSKAGRGYVEQGGMGVGGEEGGGQRDKTEIIPPLHTAFKIPAPFHKLSND